MKIGVMFGSPETTTGGNALKFYSSVRLDIRALVRSKKATKLSVTRRVKVVKNKVSPPAAAEFQIMYGAGIYHMGEVLDWGVKLTVDKSALGMPIKATRSVKVRLMRRSSWTRIRLSRMRSKAKFVARQ